MPEKGGAVGFTSIDLQHDASHRVSHEFILFFKNLFILKSK